MALQMTITGSLIRRILTAAAAVGVLVALVAVISYWTEDSEPDPLTGAIKKRSFQAVILSNDRIYFGRLRAVGDGYYRLKKAAFLRETSTTDGKNQRTVPQLVRITEELHGPEHAMILNREQIVAVENLASDSKVAQLMRERATD